MDHLDKVKLDAFFDEFAELEKRALLEKIAGVGVVKGVVKGVKRLVSRPLKEVPEVLRRGYQRGVRKAEKATRKSFAGEMPTPKGVELSLPRRVVAGMRGVAATPTGKALGAGAAGLGAAGLGAAGLGAAASGRGSRHSQNVYVR